MSGIIVYASRYGTSREYAEKLSGLTGIPAFDRRRVPELPKEGPVVFIGGTYAGKVADLKKTLRGFVPSKEQPVIIAAVGLSDRSEQESAAAEAEIKKQLPPAAAAQAKIFLLRGKIDYSVLKPFHRLALALMNSMSARLPESELPPESRIITETYGKKADFTDFGALNGIMAALSESGALTQKAAER